MHPMIEYSFVLAGLAVGYRSGGYLGTFLILTSLVAGIRQYIQVKRGREECYGLSLLSLRKALIPTQVDFSV